MDRWKAEQGRGREKRKIRREKIRRERVRRKKMQMREKVGKSRNTVFFQWFVAPEAEPAGQMRDEKLHAVVARSTFRSQNAQNTPCSDHFGSSDVVSRGRSRDCAPSQKWVNREGFVAFPKTMAGVGHLKRICKDAFSVAGAVQETSSSELVRVVISWEGLHFGASDLEVCYFAWQVQHFVWHGITFSWQAQYFRQVDWKNRKTNWYEAVSSALNFPFWKEVSQNCFVFDVVKVQKLVTSRRIASCWMLSSSKTAEVSQTCFVFDVVNFEKWGSLAELLRFWCCQLKKMRKSRRIAAFFWLSTLKNEEVSQNI